MHSVQYIEHISNLIIGFDAHHLRLITSTGNEDHIRVAVNVRAQSTMLQWMSKSGSIFSNIALITEDKLMNAVIVIDSVND